MSFEKYYAEGVSENVFKFSLMYTNRGANWELYLPNEDIIIYTRAEDVPPPGEAMDILTDVNYPRRKIINSDSKVHMNVLRDELVADEVGLRAIMSEYVDDFVSGRFKVSIKPYLTPKGRELLGRMNAILWTGRSGEVRYIIGSKGYEIDADLRNELVEFIEWGKEYEKREMFKHIIGLMNGRWRWPLAHDLDAELAKELKRYFTVADEYGKFRVLSYLRRLKLKKGRAHD